ncbi:hypothetical protein AAVH_16846 [Aphelenchoides avenae]|nr:hypothetical protein AAVH_16846 [Aphelenchus avenae]
MAGAQCGTECGTEVSRWIPGPDVSETLSMWLPPGCLVGTEWDFELADGSSIMLVVRDKPHKHFHREGSDLHHAHRLVAEGGATGRSRQHLLVHRRRRAADTRRTNERLGTAQTDMDFFSNLEDVTDDGVVVGESGNVMTTPMMLCLAKL